MPLYTNIQLCFSFFYLMMIGSSAGAFLDVKWALFNFFNNKSLCSLTLLRCVKCHSFITSYWLLLVHIVKSPPLRFIFLPPPLCQDKVIYWPFGGPALRIYPLINCIMVIILYSVNFIAVWEAVDNSCWLSSPLSYLRSSRLWLKSFRPGTTLVVELIC